MTRFAYYHFTPGTRISGHWLPGKSDACSQGSALLWSHRCDDSEPPAILPLGEKYWQTHKGRVLLSRAWLSVWWKPFQLISLQNRLVTRPWYQWFTAFVYIEPPGKGFGNYLSRDSTCTTCHLIILARGLDWELHSDPIFVRFLELLYGHTICGRK